MFMPQRTLAPGGPKGARAAAPSLAAPLVHVATLVFPRQRPGARARAPRAALWRRPVSERARAWRADLCALLRSLAASARRMPRALPSDPRLTVPPPLRARASPRLRQHRHDERAKGQDAARARPGQGAAQEGRSEHPPGGADYHAWPRLLSRAPPRRRDRSHATSPRHCAARPRQRARRIGCCRTVNHLPTMPDSVHVHRARAGPQRARHEQAQQDSPGAQYARPRGRSGELLRAHVQRYACGGGATLRTRQECFPTFKAA